MSVASCFQLHDNVSCSQWVRVWLREWETKKLFPSNLFFLIGPDPTLEPKWQWLCNGRLSTVGSKKNNFCRRCSSTPACRYVCMLIPECIALKPFWFLELCLLCGCSSGACHDNGSSVWGCVLCRHWHGPRTQVSKRGRQSRLLQSAKLHSCH